METTEEFFYPKKENYTQSEVDKILAEHATAVVKDYVHKDEYEALQGELTPLKAEKRQSHLKTLVPDNANIDEYDTLLALAKVSDDDDDETIKTKFGEIVEKKSFLQKVQKIQNPAPEAVKTIKKSEPTKIETKDENLNSDSIWSRI